MSAGARTDGPGPPSVKGAATLGLVLQTSTELFAERGFAATTMRQLADRAGLPLSAFYYYFRRKYDVLLAIMDEAMGRLEARAEAVVDPALSPAEQLVALVESHVGVHLERPAAALVADGEIRALAPDDRAAFVARRDAYEARFRTVLEAGVGAGSFAPDLDVALASISILTMSTGVVHWWRSGGRLTADETAAELAGMALSLVSR